MVAYYNEHDPYAADWLRRLIAAGLIAPGKVDDRSIVDVRSADLQGYDQCHFFAGIGGWSLALRLAGWPDDKPVWTGSCPCQPFSDAGQRLAEEDPRHLWPQFRRLIAECSPPVVFGEQTASKLGRSWLSGLRSDLEALGFAVGAADLCAAGVGAPHIRPRLWFVADADRESKHGRAIHAEMAAISTAVSNSNSESLGRPAEPRRERHIWSDEPDVDRVAHGVPSRMDKLRGLGNAIVPQVAAEFITAFAECRP